MSASGQLVKTHSHEAAGNVQPDAERDNGSAQPHNYVDQVKYCYGPHEKVRVNGRYSGLQPSTATTSPRASGATSRSTGTTPWAGGSR